MMPKMTQSEALDILKIGANVFLTGEPGAGKTHTINAFVAWLRQCGIEPAITASTGIAATHIGGLTIHAWSSIGIRRDLTAYDVDQITQNKSAVARITKTRILIIDEVSMLSARTLDMVETVCREVRRVDAPFGGLQVVFVGDFFQLPPVSRSDDRDGPTIEYGDHEPQGVFAFQSRAWRAANPIVCYLHEQHRQEDGDFLALLTAIRRGTFGESHKGLLRTRYRKTPLDGVTQLYSHNADVDTINAGELEKIDNETRTYYMQSQGSAKLVDALKRGCLSPEVLHVKLGARVMFTRNDVEGQQYANGTLGEVVGFSEDMSYPVVRTNQGREVVAEPDEWRIEDGPKVLARITQIPLRLAWAITVHKSQGMSLDAAHMDLSGTFEYGQGYVALSRVRTLAGLSVAGLNQRAVEVHPDIQAQEEIFHAASDRAAQTFAQMSRAELAKMHENYIRAIGGRLPGEKLGESDPPKSKSAYHERIAKGSSTK
ncbi:AAA family ATPase [Candidatus Kaiserbacteria bacterium]|nr:AAA family ATPase [Candidatus Kaiserbacteria bacterium]